MSSKQPSSREVFIKRIGASLAEAGTEKKVIIDWDPFGDNPAGKVGFEKLCSDARMQGVWDLTARLPDGELEGFIYALQVAWAAGDQHLRVIEDCGGALRAHEDCKTALAQLRISAEQMRGYLKGEFGEHPSGHDKHFRYLNHCFDSIEAVLDFTTSTAREDLRDFREGATQKIGELHYTEFTGLAVEAMEDYFEQPHYELVAAMVAVLFDKEVDKEAIRSVARKFKARRAVIRSRAEAAVRSEPKPSDE